MFRALFSTSLVLGISLSTFFPSRGNAYGEASVIQSLVLRQSPIPIIKPSWGNFILHTESLNKLYSFRRYEAVWVNEQGFPNEMALALRNVLMSAEQHGLSSADYWDQNIEDFFQKTRVNPRNWITFELAASEALIRYVTHLSTGRIDPEMVDNDVKFKKKNFNDYEELSKILVDGPESLANSLNIFAPSGIRYVNLMEVLQTLRGIKSEGGWGTLSSPGFVLKMGVSAPVVSQIRKRLNQLGYGVNLTGGNFFDREFERAIKKFQLLNGLVADGIIGVNSQVFRALNYSLNQRISQVEVTMEKLRWLPRNLETRHIFVNLASTELRLFDETGLVFDFKTVNGQPFRRTPSMKDFIRYVNLNPFWTVPRSIAIKDKLPRLKEDSGYLAKHNMLLIEEATDQIVDPATIDWRNMTARQFSYYIKQLPGPENALGVVKFPLQNPWAIYMHDTNEKNLFQESERHRSSGCVRLEKPLELAAYLLEDQQDWSLENIQSFVPRIDGQQAVEIDKKIFLSRPMPVYFMYLTVEKAESGEIRFFDDVYGQDLRLGKALQNKRSVEEIF